MTADARILDERDPIKGPFIGAVAIHIAVIGGLAVFNFATKHTMLGAPDAGGTAVGVEAVKSIPLPHRGPANPVANDTQSELPQERAKKEAVKEPEIPKDAIRLRAKEVKRRLPKASPKFRSFDDLQPNQLTSSQPQAISDPKLTSMPGAGRVGAGENTTLGEKCGAYAAQIRQIIAQKWKTGDVDARLKSAPPVISTFEIVRDGTVRGVTLTDKSGNSSLDYSVQRAILDSNPLPPLPSCFDKNTAKVELWFELKR
jgi:outer membrane biosynthesis protein TonB